MRSLNPDQLEAFVQVVRLGSFSAAAARLNLTQPAISLQLRQLEQRLGVRLIERVGRRATATAAGLELMGHAARIEAALLAAGEAMASHAKGEVGRVRIGTGATACIYLLPPVLAGLRQRLPALEIVVTTGNTPEILRAVEDNLLDAALVTLPAPGRMFQVRPIVEDPFVAIFPAGEELPARATPGLLSARPLVLFEPGARTRSLVDAWFLAGGLPARPMMELGSVEAIKEMVGAGLGCSVLPGMAMAAGHPRLAWRPLSPRLARSLALVMRQDKPLSRGLRETVAALVRLGESVAAIQTAEPKEIPQ
ncbi:DNA-binding transcriptional LysR family regulator [Stella humosa]|uniref:DNA-binding transcriptional LysR family regulator n=1 Tax=Stella humosa TaxID=94 RepID=A0A3N1KRH0_9PROT|nr:LysR family transcriptional regulator [Stella humosa]ROP81389.1 DNA-binding transcriptional LysR family regulator [Stella humosa]BBK32740.1 LysR family transcriptional regulator [Stella humosa]